MTLHAVALALVALWLVRHHLAFAWARVRGERYGASMLTWSGAEVHPLDPRPDTICVEDIARGLANECRYAGHVQRFYSVAEHSVVVSIVLEEWARDAGWDEKEVVAIAREGLMHDAEEAYLGDMIRPMKYHHRMSWFRRAAHRLRAVIYDRLGIRSTRSTARLAKFVDDLVLVDEVALRHDPDGSRARRYLTKYGASTGIKIVGLPPVDAEFLFMARYVELWHGDLPDMMDLDDACAN